MRGMCKILVGKHIFCFIYYVGADAYIRPL